MCESRDSSYLHNEALQSSQVFLQSSQVFLQSSQVFLQSSQVFLQSSQVFLQSSQVFPCVASSPVLKSLPTSRNRSPRSAAGCRARAGPIPKIITSRCASSGMSTT